MLSVVGGVISSGSRVRGAEWHAEGQLDERVEELVKQLTLAEKVDQLHAGITPTGGVPRLNLLPFQGWGGTPSTCRRVAESVA